MPDINDKGISVPDWLFKALWTLSAIFLGSIYVDMKEDRKNQAQINTEVTRTLQQIQNASTAETKDLNYILKEMQEAKDERREMQREIRQLQKEHNHR